MYLVFALNNNGVSCIYQGYDKQAGIMTAKEYVKRGYLLTVFRGKEKESLKVKRVFSFSIN